MLVTPLMNDETLCTGFGYTLSKDNTVVVLPDFLQVFWKGIPIAKRFSKICIEKNNKLLALAKKRFQNNLKFNSC
jgi:hypothetical protein